MKRKYLWKTFRVWVKPPKGKVLSNQAALYVTTEDASSVSSAVASVAKSHGYKKSELAGKLWKHSKRNPKTGMLTFTHVGWGTMKNPQKKRTTMYHTIKNRRRGE